MSQIDSKEANLKELELNALLELTQAINSNLPEESLYKIYHFTMLANLKVKKLALFVLGEQWECKVEFGLTHDLSEIEMPEEYRCLEDKLELVDSSIPFDCFDLVIPIRHKNRLLANVFVGNIAHSEGLAGESSFTFLEALTNITLVAIENKKMARRELEQEAYRKELEIAKQVQQFLFPKSLPKTDDLEIDAVYLPHHNVGGDYYDYIKIDDNRFLACIADVSGKGVPAALMMSNFQASLRTLIRQTTDLKRIVSELNYQIHLSGNAEIFITFFVAIFDRDSQHLDYINCGHNLPLLLLDDQIQLLDKGTTVLGMFHPLPFLESGAISGLNNFFLLLYTDGLSEAESSEGEEFGEKRLEDVLKKVKDKSPTEVNLDLLKAVNVHRRDKAFHDDVTIVSIQKKQ